MTRAEAAARLRTAVTRASRRLRQTSGDELTPSQNSLINTLARHGAMTPSALAESERISRPTATRIVAKLRDRGLVTTREDEHDGRSYTIAVSDDGVALRELRRARKNAFLTGLLRRATDEEVQLLAAAADLLLELLEEGA